MGGSESGREDIFNVERIKKLVQIMDEHDLSELDLRQEDQRIRLRRGHDPIIAPAPAAPAPAVPAQQAAAAAGAGAEAARPIDESHLTVIKSPMVGTFYPSPNPESPPFVQVGDMVGPETTVCIIEAMKVFNEIAAECSGKIVSVLAESGDPVEFDQPLFKVDRSG